MSTNNIQNNIVSLYSISSTQINDLVGVPNNILFFTIDDASIGKLYRGGGQNMPLQFIGTETALRLENKMHIYGNEFDGTQDVSHNLTMTGTLDNSTGSGLFNELNVSNKLSTNNLFLNDNTISFKDVNGNNVTLTLDTSTFGQLDIEANVISKIFNNVDEVFDPSINDISDDQIGTTYFVKSGTSDINIPETFILNSNREIIPTSSYVVSKNVPDSKYNYHKGNILWIDKLYSSENSSDLDASDSEIDDNTVITAESYYDLKKAIDKLYYILGIDMDAGKVEDTTDSEAEGIDAGEFDENTPIVKSNYGIILTDINNNQKTAFSDFETEEKPEWLAALDEDVEDDNNDSEILPEDEIILPDELDKELTSLGEHFVKAIRIKRGKYSDMIAMQNYLLDGELVWCIPERNNTIQAGKLYIKTKDSLGKPVMMPIGGTNSSNNNETNYLTELVDIEKIDWINDYRLSINNDGKIIITKIADSGNITMDTTRGNAKLYINSLYIGGNDSSIGMYRQCSHNFIEISNLTPNDINLEKAGLSIQYIDNTCKDDLNLNWKIIPLTGTIKAGSTYLVRGAECAPMDCNTTRLQIESYDQIWYDNNKEISFSDIDNPVFVLCKSEKDANDTILPISSKYNTELGTQGLYTNNNVYDVIGFNTGALYYEKSPVNVSALYRTQNNDEDYKLTDFLFVKYFSMDGIKQATKAQDKKDNSKDIYAINLRENYQYNIEQYYSGKASYENKTIFYNKLELLDGPNMITCSFGKQATDNGNGATRCFNWISRGYYNEYIKLTYPDGSIKYFESFKNKNQERIFTGQKQILFTVEDNHYYNYDENGKIIYDENGKSTSRFSYSGIYDRYRDITVSKVPFTVHKLIIDNLPAGKYTYQIGKQEGWSEEYTFIVKTADDVNNNGFNFIHHSDQQGFHGDEYVAWKIVADYINSTSFDKNSNNYSFDFTINTGDMTQNGNRVSEWLDYYNCGKSIFLHSEQMNTVGNNDLAPIDNTRLGDGNDDSKINPKNFDIYYCYDLDINEQDLLTINVNNQLQLIPSNYSFNIGNCHFVCINSEITINTCKKVYNTDVKTISNKIANWLENDLKTFRNNNDGWIVAYCHEMPFTILTNDNLLANYNKDKKEFTYPNQYPDRHNVYNTATGCHLNCLPIDASGYVADNDGNIVVNNNEKTIINYDRYYWVSRLLEKYNTSLVLGGHKHTYSSSLPIKENIIPEIIENDNGVIKSFAILSRNGKNEDYTKTYKPIIQLNRNTLKDVFGEHDDDELKRLWYNNGKNECSNDEYAYTELLKQQYEMCFENNICDIDDIELIDDDKYTNPIYVMCQASGYKLISNKELPGRYIPWLTTPTTNSPNDKTYYPVTVKTKNNTKSLECNKLQLYPIYIKWNIKNNKIEGTPLRFSINGNKMFYTGNTNSIGTYQLINEINYNFYDSDNNLRKLENVDGISNRKNIIIKK